MTHGDLALEVKVDFLAVVEHRIIPAGVRVNGPGSGGRRWPPFGLLRARIPPMLVMLGLVLSV